MKNEDLEFFTSRELSQLLKVNVVTIRRWINSKKLPALFFGKEYRVKKEDFEKFLRNRRKQ